MIIGIVKIKCCSCKEQKDKDLIKCFGFNDNVNFVGRFVDNPINFNVKSFCSY